MKKIIVLLMLLFVSIPALAIEIYNDGNYSYQTDSVMFVNNQRELIYTLYAIPTIKNILRKGASPPCRGTAAGRPLRKTPSPKA